MAGRIEIIEGDITRLKVDAIVVEECRTLGGCETGHAKLTAGYDLHATWVIHTVGPVWTNGENGEDRLLAECYRSSLALAVKCFSRTVAFPSISTGVFRFPVERAARIALKEISAFLAKDTTLEKVTIVCFDRLTFETYDKMSG